MEDLKKKRGSIKSTITRLGKLLTSAEVRSDIPGLRMRLEKYEPLLEKFDAIQSEIEKLVEIDESEALVQERERELFEFSYFNVLSHMREIIRKSDLAESRSTAANSVNIDHESISNVQCDARVSLPKLNIPEFNGDYSNWIKFRDTFLSLIHNNLRLSGIQKFHYLDRALTGDAARIIASVGISEENYEDAWNSIKARYEDENELIYHHVSGIFEAAPMTHSSDSSELRKLLDKFNNHILSLNALKEPTDRWDTLLVYLLTSKLHVAIRNEWEKHLSKQTGKVTLNSLKSFLENYCKFLHKSSSRVTLKDNKDTKDTKTHVKNKNFKNNQVKSYHVTAKSCILCKGSHALYVCEEFKKLLPSERLSKVRELNVCYNCLSTGHRNKECKFGPCRKCGRKHNSLLCLDSVTLPSQSVTQIVSSIERKADEQAVQSTPQINYSAQVSFNSSSYVLLPTATLYVFDRHGKKHEIRALLDSCSQAHIITSELCTRLNLSKRPASTALTGIEQGAVNIAHQTTVRIKSRINDFTATITCLVIDKISDDLPKTQMNLANVEIPDGIELADKNYNRSKTIDLLIGTALYYELCCVGQIKLKNQPILQKTLLGWIIAGQLNFATPTNKLICNLIKRDELSAQIERFWNIEHSYSESRSVHHKMDFAERHFKATTKRDNDGRFILSIPFDTMKLSKLGTSKELAYKRLLSMERRFKRDSILKDQYIEFMNEYEALGHMSEISNLPCDDSVRHFYLPHHSVTKAGSTTTKLRVVFDGSAKSSTGVSLNDTQYVGSPVQEELFSIMLRFRQHLVVLSADVAKMYRQLWIDKDERKMQRILWRTSETLPVKIYELNTVTYGTASAPFLATRCLKEIGESCREQNPTASNTILRDFYVDDCLSGAATVEAAKNLKADLCRIFRAAGLELRKWASNEPRAIRNSNDTTGEVILFQEGRDPKTLGLLWDPKTDILKYQICMIDMRKITKRSILSAIAQIFDPLGLVGPVIIRAKVLMQKLWSMKLDWDESLPQEIHCLWDKIYSDMINVNTLMINRCVRSRSSKAVEFHGFCDASQTAYGACIYVCTVDRDSNRTVRLLCAKSRVAPLKQISIPRLELLGALLLAQLSHKISAALNLKKDEWHFWTDSMVVLSWIRAPSAKWKTFVANRVTEIQELTNGNWKHVSTAENPADLISRGLAANELHNCRLWWTGPWWLTHKIDAWPSSMTIDTDDTVEQREKEHVLVLKINRELVIQEEPINANILEYVGRFSSFSRMIHTTAYILRFMKNCKDCVRSRKFNNIVYTDAKRKISDKEPTALSVKEISLAELRLIKLCQLETLHEEMISLRRDNKNYKGKLKQLNPFFDSDSILRVGGRLQNALIPYAEKHPIILEGNNKYSELLINYEHKKLLHAGCQAVIAYLRKRYWLLAAKNNVKRVIGKCVVCFRARPRGSSYLMGNLPTLRVVPSRPFYICGVDYAGPLFIKEKARSRAPIKTYICLFVCFATKAVHIELAADLSTIAFLNCFKRFISRRGKCHKIFSDNGTNFVGAKNELNSLYKLLNDKNFANKVTEYLNLEKIIWEFIPPHAPHFGGLWESAVKSAKFHLLRVIGDTRLTYEEMYTVLTQIEACLNSRPISPLSTDPNDLTPLTPGHFLIGDLLTAMPQEDVRDVKIARLNRFQLMQQMVQHFWQRWHREYLPQLQSRFKWQKSTERLLSTGQLVLIKEDNMAPMQWPLGRITEMHPGSDGIVRVVSIRVAKGIIKRPVSKICILPISSDREEEQSNRKNNL